MSDVRPTLTVAALVERDGRFLCVEERIDGVLRLNQPAGHVEPGEDPLAAVVRETREETAWHFEPQSLLGCYLWRDAKRDKLMLRIAFGGQVRDHDPTRALDRDIHAAVWLTAAELQARERDWRSPLVGRCLADHLRGQRAPLSILATLGLEPLP